MVYQQVENTISKPPPPGQFLERFSTQPTFQLLSDLSSNSQRRDMDTSEQYPGAGQRGTSRGARGASTKGALLG